MLSLAVAVVSLSLAPVLPSQGPAPAGNAALPEHPNLWPQDITANGKTYRIFQPRVTGLDGMRAYLVTEVSMTAADGSSVTGEAQLQAEVMAADVPGEVEVNQFAVRRLVVHGAPAADEDVKALSQALYVVAMTTTRPNLLQNMRLVNARGSSTPGLGTQAPQVVVSAQPAVLVSVDGQPRLAPLGATGWSSVSNTPFILLQSKDGSWWTRVGGAWQASADLSRPFAAASAPPPDEVVAALGKAPPVPADVSRMPPAVKAPALRQATAIVATQPTVLVSIDSAPQLVDACAGVQQVKNCNSILLTLDGSSFYVLAAGRWFMTKDLGSGRWNLVAPQDVPAEFAKLPRTKRFDGARAAVPGTPEANEAALAAREIRTVTLNRAGTQPKVEMAGGGPIPAEGPAWRQVEGIAVKWLPGATQPVFMSGGKAYCCDSAAWFVAPSPSGPWALCDQVPAAIYAVPPTVPTYAATYVWVFGSTPDTVTFGFSPGYLGTYLSDGTPVYGTGHAYANPASGPYQPYPQTYGCDTAYDAQTGTFCPPDDPNDDYAYYGGADVNPAYLDGYGWTGWGWCPGWNVGWGYGWNNWWGWDHWGWWANNWHPYSNRWLNNHADWERQDRRDAAQRVAQRTQPLDRRQWAPARGAMASAGRTDIKSAAGSAARRDASPAAARENQAAIDRQFRGAAGDAPVAYRGPSDAASYAAYGSGYPAEAYRPWTGQGSNLGGNWAYSPLAGPNGFHPSQQFVDPGAYWGSGTRLGNNVGPNAGPYHSPDGHGGWGTYDHWAGEGVRGTEYPGNRGGDGRNGNRGDDRGGDRR